MIRCWYEPLRYVPGGKWIAYTGAQVIARRAARIGMRLVCVGVPVFGAFVPPAAWAPAPAFYGPPAPYAPEYWPGMGQGGYDTSAPYFPGVGFGGPAYGPGYIASGYLPPPVHSAGYSPHDNAPNVLPPTYWPAHPPFGPDDVIRPPTDIGYPGTPTLPPNGTPIVDVPKHPPTEVPEPTSLVLLVIGTLLVIWNRRRA
jgi:hypothetical protein